MADPSRRVPDGIRDEHQQSERGLRGHASAVPLLLLSLLMLWALLGFAGREVTLQAEEGGTTLRWHAPERIRNGEFFEMRLTVESSEAIDALTVEIPEALWRDFTVNTFIPAASEESGEDGAFRFSFGALEPGTEFTMKVDAQLNPDVAGTNSGDVVILDGDEELVRLPVSIAVLP